MANYIKTLEAQNADATASAMAVSRAMTEMRAHLVSPKFAVDSTIQTGDVDRMLLAAQQAGVDAEWASRWLMVNASGEFAQLNEWRRERLQVLADLIAKGVWVSARAELATLSDSDRASIPAAVAEQLATIF